MDGEPTSADFIQFTDEDLLDELCRRSDTIVCAMLVQPQGHQGIEKNEFPSMRIFWQGNPHARHGLAHHLCIAAAKSVMEEYGR
jgi:hypothetical protein